MRMPKCSTDDGDSDEKSALGISDLQAWVLPCWLNAKESACNAGGMGSVPGLGKSPEGGHGSLFQHPCQENPTDSGAWWAPIHWVTESDMTEATKHSTVQTD